MKLLTNAVSIVTAMIGMLLFDMFGRRDLTIHGCWIQTVFLCVIGALGSKTNPKPSETNGMVASFILYTAVLHATLGPAAYITSAEVGTTSLREKTMAAAVSLTPDLNTRRNVFKLTKRYFRLPLMLWLASQWSTQRPICFHYPAQTSARNLDTFGLVSLALVQFGLGSSYQSSKIAISKI